MPKNLDEVAFASAEYEEIARMGIATETLLDLQRQGVHPAPHSAARTEPMPYRLLIAR